MHSRPFARVAAPVLALSLAASICSAQIEWPGEELNNHYRNVACTYFGELNHDRVQGVSQMPDGRILIAGETTSRFDLQPATSAWGLVPYTPHHVWANGDGTSIETDAFIAILSADLKHLEQWAYIGGCDGDRAYYAEADADSIYVVGITKSIRGCSQYTFPTTTAPYGTSGPLDDFDVFVARFDHALYNRWESIVLAGDVPGEENSRGSLTLVKDASNNATAVYISGVTRSPSFPVDELTLPGHPPNTVDHVMDGLSDAFLIRFTPTLTKYWGTFYGGGGDEYAAANVRYHAALDAVFIGGLTTSGSSPSTQPNLPIPGSPFVSYDSTPNGGFDGFVARFAAGTGALQAATYLGGNGDDRIGYNDDLELTPAGNVAVAGATTSTNFPVTLNAPQSAHSNAGASADLFLTVLDSSLSQSPYFSTYFGGTSIEEASGLAVDHLGRLYLTGETRSPGFPTAGRSAFDADFTDAQGMHPGGYADCFIIKLDPASPAPGQTLKYGSFFSGNTNGAPPGSSVNDPPQGARGRSLLYDLATHTLILAGQTTTLDFPTTAGAEFPLYKGVTDGFVARHFPH